MKIGIVIPVRAGGSLSKDTIDSLNKIQEHVNFVKIIYGKNVSRQRNSGVKEIADRVDVIALLDDDVSFEPEVFIRLVKMAYETSMLVHSDASWFFRPEVYKKVGGFDERFIRVYEEDTDFNERAKRLGLLLRVDGIKHPKKVANFRKLFLMRFNKALYMLKNERDLREWLRQLSMPFKVKHPLRILAHIIFYFGIIYYGIVVLVSGLHKNFVS
ncbi:MAG: hypothetical protein NZ931_02710 [Aigarchaeota archaeon]|nr:hypothetical protein [Aigarchaeota archaeon]